MLFTTVLKDNKAFQKCYRQGRYVVCGYVCAYFLPNRSPYNRLGITVTKKNGNAVVRNRIKRIIRAAYRLNEEKIPIGYDVVFVGRNDIAEKSSADIERFISGRLAKEMNKPFEKPKKVLGSQKKNKESQSKKTGAKK